MRKLKFREVTGFPSRLSIYNAPTFNLPSVQLLALFPGSSGFLLLTFQRERPAKQTGRFTSMAANVLIDPAPSVPALFRVLFILMTTFCGQCQLPEMAPWEFHAVQDRFYFGTSMALGEKTTTTTTTTTTTKHPTTTNTRSTVDIFQESGRLHKNDTFIYKLNFNSVCVYLALHYE